LFEFSWKQKASILVRFLSLQNHHTNSTFFDIRCSMWNIDTASAYKASALEMNFVKEVTDFSVKGIKISWRSSKTIWRYAQLYQRVEFDIHYPLMERNDSLFVCLFVCLLSRERTWTND
jgi:hypothetical protein